MREIEHTHENFSRFYKRGTLWWGGRLMVWFLGITLVLGVGAWIAGASAKSSMREHNPPPGKLVDVGGYRMHIYCTGEGSPTVVMAAGLDDFSIFWSLVQPEVAKFTRVCSFDRAGLGWSDPGPYPRTSRIMVKELSTLIVKAGIEGPYVLVGHSFGGAQLKLYAYEHPGDIAGMVLVDATPDDLFDRIPSWPGLIDKKIALFRMLAPMESIGLLALVPTSIPNRGLPEKALEQYRVIAASTRYFETGIAENEAFQDNLAEVRAAGVELPSVPIIVMSRGYWDSLPGLSKSENQQAWLAWQEMQSNQLDLSPDSRLVIASRSEHNILLQEPQLVVDSIHDVITAIQESPSINN